MGVLIDLTNRDFTRLLVIKRVENDKWGKPCWLCLCDCGNCSIVRGGQLKSGHTKSCGCLRKTVGGVYGTFEYQAYCNMKSRCYNPKNIVYKYYEGRGIEVCDRWLNSFAAFFNDMGKRPGSGYSIERINNDGNYTPDNCKWATQKEQAGNTRNNKLFKAISPIGRVYTSKNQSEFARQFNLSQVCINICLHDRQQTHRGWRFTYI